LGSYPTWGQVLAVGNFSAPGKFHVTKVKKGVVHIGVGGVGCNARDLVIKKDDVLGEPVVSAVYHHILSTIYFVLILMFTGDRVFAVLGCIVLMLGHFAADRMVPVKHDYPGKSLREIQLCNQMNFAASESMLVFDENEERPLFSPDDVADTSSGFEEENSESTNEDDSSIVPYASDGEVVDEETVGVPIDMNEYSLDENPLNSAEEDSALDVAVDMGDHPDDEKPSCKTPNLKTVDTTLLRKSYKRSCKLPLIVALSSVGLADGWLYSAATVKMDVYPDGHVPVTFDIAHKLYTSCYSMALDPKYQCCSEDSTRIVLFELFRTDERYGAYLDHMCPKRDTVVSYRSEDSIDELVASAMGWFKGALKHHVIDKGLVLIDATGDIVDAVFDDTLYLAKKTISGTKGLAQDIEVGLTEVTEKVWKPSVAMNKGSDLAIDVLKSVAEGADVAIARSYKPVDLMNFMADTGAGVLSDGKLFTNIVNTSGHNILSEIYKKSPCSEPIAIQMRESYDFALNDSWSVYHWLRESTIGTVKYFSGGGLSKRVSKLLYKMPRYSKMVGQTIGAFPNGVLDGAGVDVKRTILNPTYNNVKGYREALFGKRTESGWSWWREMILWNHMWSGGTINVAISVLMTLVAYAVLQSVVVAMARPG